MRKLLRSTLVISLLCMLCTGCASLVMEGSVNTDGTGTISAAAGIHESLLRYSYELSEEASPTGMSFEEYVHSNPDMADYTPYSYNNETYWGLFEELAFSSPEELNTVLFSDENSMPDGSGSLVRDENGDFTLTLNITRSKIEENSTEPLTEENLRFLKELNDAAPTPMHFFFSFPKKITFSSGSPNCMTVDKNSVMVDLFAASLELESSGADALSFIFSTASTPAPSAPTAPTTPAVPVSPTLTFSDTPATAWYTPAVEALAKGGLVNGVGDGRFAPEQTLSVSEFAQILARASGMEVGAGESGYWAEKAISACVDAGYITDRGAASKENYEIPIERQEAVAAMQRAGKRTPTGALTAADIPDFESIAPAYRQDILAAYNSGVTNGTDDLRTFVPAGLLTRGQVCQLFYNLDWTAPLS